MSIVLLAAVLLLGVVTGEQPAKTLPSVAPAAPVLPPVRPLTQAGGIPGIGPELPTSGAMPGAPAQGMRGVLGGASMPILGPAQGKMGASSQGFGGLGAMLGKLGGMGEELGSPVPMPPMPPMPCPSLIAVLLRMGNSTDTTAQLHAICVKELGSMCQTVFKELGSRPWAEDAVNRTCNKFGYNITRAWQDEMQEEQQETMQKLQTIIHAVVAENNNSLISSQRLFDLEPSIPGDSQGIGTSAWAAFGAGCIVVAAATMLFVRGTCLTGTRPIGMAPVEDRDLEEQMRASEEQGLHE